MAIRLRELDDATAAALRFLESVKELREAEERFRLEDTANGTWIRGGMKAAAMKRKSMELTRALARLRRS